MSNIWTLLGLIKAQNLLKLGALLHFSLVDTHPPNFQTGLTGSNVNPCSCKKCIDNEYIRVKFIGIGKTSFQIIRDNDPELDRENIMHNRTMITTIPTIWIPQCC